VLHLADDDLPSPSVPPVGVASVGSGSVAVPNLAFLSAIGFEGRKAAGREAGLAIHGRLP
jgi:hypothetical protein